MKKRKLENPTIDVTNLEGGYGSVQIVNGISLGVNQGEMVAIIGPNGSGKSTFIKIIYGLATQYTGTVRFSGKETSDFKTNKLVKMGIGYVPQRQNVFEDLTVMENLQMGAFTRKDSIRDDIERIFELFPELQKKQSELALNLSGGQRQMLALSRALMNNPSILLLDEPTAALSPNLVTVLLERISKLREEGLTVLIVEQNAKSALKYADYGYVFANGEVVYHDTSKVLQNADLGRLFLGMKPEIMEETQEPSTE